MAPILGLFVHSRIPVRVQENYTVCSRKIDADTTASGTAYKAKQFGRKIKSVNHFLPSFYFH